MFVILDAGGQPLTDPDTGERFVFDSAAGAAELIRPGERIGRLIPTHLARGGGRKLSQFDDPGAWAMRVKSRAAQGFRARLAPRPNWDKVCPTSAQFSRARERILRGA